METALTTHIRFAILDDLDFIYNSLIVLFTEQGVIKRFSQSKASLSKALFGDQSIAELIIIEVDKHPAGFALFSMTNRNFLLFEDPGLYLHDLYVQKQHRRMGLATKLIEQLKAIARERSCNRIDWVLLNNNQLGGNFYASMDEAKSVDYIKYMRIGI